MFTSLEIVLICFSVVCALTDILESKIYNIITLPMLVGGLVYHLLGVFYPEFSGGSLLSFGRYLGIGLIWAVVWFGLFGVRVVAGGDVKFFVALYAWTGPPEILLLSAYILMAAGVLTLVYLIEDRRLWPLVRGTIISLFSGVRLTSPDREYQRPLGFAMLLGTMAYILWK